MQHVGCADTAGCAFISQASTSAFFSCMNVSAVREPITAPSTQSADIVQCLCDTLQELMNPKGFSMLITN